MALEVVTAVKRKGTNFTSQMTTTEGFWNHLLHCRHPSCCVSCTWYQFSTGDRSNKLKVDCGCLRRGRGAGLNQHRRLSPAKVVPWIQLMIDDIFSMANTVGRSGKESVSQSLHLLQFSLTHPRLDGQCCISSIDLCLANSVRQLLSEESRG